MSPTGSVPPANLSLHGPLAHARENVPPSGTTIHPHPCQTTGEHRRVSERARRPDTEVRAAPPRAPACEGAGLAVITGRAMALLTDTWFTEIGSEASTSCNKVVD